MGLVIFFDMFKKDFKYFVAYKDCKKMSAYWIDFDETKYMSFW